MKPKVTVLMPVYNTAGFLKEAIESILTQTYRDFELIIINDGSTDDSQRVIESFNDPRIKVIRNEQNIGIIKSRNKGLLLAQGDFIANMDSDDVSQPTRFEKQVKFLEQHQEVAIVATRLSLVDKEGKIQGNWPDDVNCTTIEAIKRSLPKVNCIGQPTVMMRADVVKPITYNENFLFNEDWGLWLTLLAEGHVIAKLDEALLNYRIHESSTTAKSNAVGVLKKTIKFKRLFFSDRIGKGSFGKIERKILTSLISDLFRVPLTWIHPRALRGLKKILTINPIKVILSYFQLTLGLKKDKNASSLFFFFPHNHVGGAEKVHADIVSCVSDNKPIVFFTKFSEGNGFLKLFKEKAVVYDIPELTKYPFVKSIVLRRVAKFINAHVNPVVFGSNSSFYYGMIPHLKEHVSCMDLVHAFIPKSENPYGHSSIPYVPKLKKRVFISKKAIEEVKVQYGESKMDPQLLERVVYIPNCVDLPDHIPERSMGSTLKVLYVGRSSFEKRPLLFGEVARKSKVKGLSVDFTMVGNFTEEFKSKYSPYLTFIDEIGEQARLRELYARNNVLLLTSIREGFPMVIMEAMAFGIVPIATSVGDVSIHIQHGYNGWIVDNGHEEKIVDDMIEAVSVLMKDKDKMDTISKNAYSYAKENFNRDRFCASYRQLLVKA